MSNTAVQTVFEAAYASREHVFGSQPANCVREAAALLPNGGQVVDLGCGDGRNSLYLLQEGFQVTAVDFAPSAIRHLEAKAQARSLDKNLRAIVGDIRQFNLPFGMDAVLAITVLENLVAHERGWVLERLKTACRIGGLAVVDSYSDRDPVATGLGRQSEFADTIVEALRPSELLGSFVKDWRIISYKDVLSEDRSHGSTHDHGRLSLLAQREA